MLDGMFKPEYLNLYQLIGYIKAHLSDLLNNTYSKNGIEWGKAWISALIQRLEEIKKEIQRGPIETKLSWSFVLALRKASVESGFIKKQDWKLFSESNLAIDKICRSFLAFLKDYSSNNPIAPNLKLFCEVFCKEMPFAEQFEPAPTAMEIKLPRSSRTNYMADGQQGEAD